MGGNTVQKRALGEVEPGSRNSRTLGIGGEDHPPPLSPRALAAYRFTMKYPNQAAKTACTATMPQPSTFITPDSLVITRSTALTRK